MPPWFFSESIDYLKILGNPWINWFLNFPYDIYTDTSRFVELENPVNNQGQPSATTQRPWKNQDVTQEKKKG